MEVFPAAVNRFRRKREPLTEQRKNLPVVRRKEAAPPPQKGKVVVNGTVLQRDLPQLPGLQLSPYHRLIEKGDPRPGTDQGLDEVQTAQLCDAPEIPDAQIPGLQRPLQHIPGARARLPHQQPLLQQVLQLADRMGKGILRRAHGDVPLGAVDQAVVSLLVKIALYNGKVQFPLVQQLQQLVGLQ